MFDLHFFTALFSIFIINIILSGDNAVVIALASRRLPDAQQKKAIFWGTVGAVGLRVVLTLAAAWILKIPFLHFIGGLLLIWIAYKLLNDDQDDGGDVKASHSLAKAIQTVIIADLVMSLDNVLAIAGISGENLLLIVIGLGISVPLIIWGSTLLMKLMEKLPIIIWAGSGLLSWTAGEMIEKDKMIHQYLKPIYGSFGWAVPLAIAIIVLSISFLMKNRKDNQQSMEKADAETETEKSKNVEG